MKAHAIIVAGGQGMRAGGETPKQRQFLGGKLMYKWSVSAFTSHTLIDQIILVVPDRDLDLYAHEMSKMPVKVVGGGKERTDSVFAGLQALNASGDDAVLIHDAARPGLDQETITALIDALQDADAAAPALGVVDALKRQGGDTLVSVDRRRLYRVQTPQSFRFTAISEALNAADQALVDDLAAIEHLGGRIALVPGSENLAKITFPGDLNRMERLIAPSPVLLRIGTGFDVHAFGAGETVTLCGVEIAHSQGLAGHSDADVAWHALTDAILGALALGDIGDHFPPSDPQWKGAASSVFLAHAVRLASDKGYDLSNCDLTIICEAPKIKPHREAMRQTTADLLGLPLDSVSVKATTTEKLGFTGRGEGIAAQAVCVLAPKPNT